MSRFNRNFRYSNSHMNTKKVENNTNNLNINKKENDKLISDIKQNINLLTENLNNYETCLKNKLDVITKSLNKVSEFKDKLEQNEKQLTKTQNDEPLFVETLENTTMDNLKKSKSDTNNTNNTNVVNDTNVVNKKNDKITEDTTLNEKLIKDDESSALELKVKEIMDRLNFTANLVDNSTTNKTDKTDIDVKKQQNKAKPNLYPIDDINLDKNEILSVIKTDLENKK